MSTQPDMPVFRAGTIETTCILLADEARGLPSGRLDLTLKQRKGQLCPVVMAAYLTVLPKREARIETRIFDEGRIVVDYYEDTGDLAGFETLSLVSEDVVPEFARLFKEQESLEWYCFATSVTTWFEMESRLSRIVESITDTMAHPRVNGSSTGSPSSRKGRKRQANGHEGIPLIISGLEFSPHECTLDWDRTPVTH
jgi:hypothetical protein